MFKAPRTTSSYSTQRAAFTLIEMMLTLVLSGVLMAGLWNLSSAYIKLFETGQQKAAESRLARALLDQISQDITGLTDPSQLEMISKTAIAGALTSSASDSSDNRSSSSSTGVGLPQFRLAGTDLSLQINTFQLRPPQFSEEEEETNDVGSELEERKHFAPNLRTIFYTFTEGEDESALSNSLPIGLIRRELDWQSMAPAFSSEQSEESEETNSEEEEVYGDNEFFLSDSQLENISLDELLTADLKNETFLWVPEVVKLRFRYSDGKTWSESWDSKYRNSLPKLIEISLDFDFEQGLDARFPIDESDSDELTPEELAADEEAESPESNLNELLNDDEDEQLPQYRRVITLPTSFHLDDEESSSSSTDDNSASPLERLRAVEEEE